LAENLTPGDPIPMDVVLDSAHTRRFRIVYVVLALVIAAALAAAALIVTQTDRPLPFSSFKPTQEDPVERSQAIADYVSQRYVDAREGNPLVTVKAGEDDKAALPGVQQVLAVGSSPPGVVSYEYGDILFYQMCAAGPDCALGPKQDRATFGPLLARQAHELAAYGLKYVPEATFVIAILPPGFVTGADPAKPPRAVHLYRRKDLENELDRPVDETLPGPVPTPSTLTPAQASQFDTREAHTRYTLDSGVDAANTLNVYNLTPPG
jgi:hypothetical protein